MNFRVEREHDERLMVLIRSLDQANRLDVLETSFSPTSPTEGVGRRQAAEIPGKELQRSALQGMSAHARSRLFRAVIFGGG